MTSLLDVLADSASRASHRAVAHYVANEVEDFYLQAGIAVEAAMKAGLVRADPAFIAPGGAAWFRHALALVKSQNDITSLPSTTKTVTAGEALDRLSDLEAGFDKLKSGIERLLAGRNGHAHLGWHGESNHQEAFVGFVRAIHALLRRDPDSFWEDYRGVVAAALDDSMAEVERHVAERIAAARDRFRVRFGRLNDDLAELVLDGIETNRNRYTWNDALATDCPACKSPALLEGSNKLDMEPDDWDRETGQVTGVRSWLTFEASELACEACGLALSGGDELEAAGVKIVFENDDADLDEYMNSLDGDEGDYGER